MSTLFESAKAEKVMTEVGLVCKVAVDEGIETANKVINSIENIPQYGSILNQLPKKIDLVLESGLFKMKGNTTEVGRAYQKHCVRAGTNFLGEVSGSAGSMV